MYEQDTIAAIATPVGEGAVAIVRVSGPDAERIAASVFVRAQGKMETWPRTALSRQDSGSEVEQVS
jgi:tRNA U34 5-carboxymethylaminomethyl modifying GTPase MnmE/TrmE